MSVTLKKSRNDTDFLEISAKDWAELEEGMECGVSLDDVLKFYVLGGKGIVYARISRITTQQVACYSCRKLFEPIRQNSMTCSPGCFITLKRMSSRKRSKIFKQAIADRRKALSEIQAED